MACLFILCNCLHKQKLLIVSESNLLIIFFIDHAICVVTKNFIAISKVIYIFFFIVGVL
jgi:hypothetical protein